MAKETWIKRTLRRLGRNGPRAAGGRGEPVPEGPACPLPTSSAPAVVPTGDDRDAQALAVARLLAGGLAFDRKYFRLWEQHGFHITPNHFYQPIPDVGRLPARLWDEPANLPGIDLNEAGQLDLLDNVCGRYRAEYDRFPAKPTGVAHEYHFDQQMFRSVDAEILYCILRAFKPQRVVEIGSGFSTLVAAAACRQNLAEGHRTDLTCIEPYPNETLRRGFPGLGKLIVSNLEDVGREPFAALGANDVLFIDSSHVLRIGNDVQREYLDILPRLGRGVFVHVHDIFLPFEYPREWVTEEYRFWSEQYLLQAFLTYNSAFRVVWAGSFMHHKHPGRLRAAFRSYHPDEVLPGSFWMQRA
jgi:hypothetical protein